MRTSNSRRRSGICGNRTKTFYDYKRYCAPSKDPAKEPTPGNNPRSGGTSGTVGSGDPNELIGPAGVGSQRFVTGFATLPYRINFADNGSGSIDPNTGQPYATFASSPAQRVTIVDQLDIDLDWSTFRLGSMGYGDVEITLPGDRLFHTAVETLAYNNRTFDVQVEAGIDLATGRVFATFQSLDPLTGLPPDVLLGFLPPEDGTDCGKGFFIYTVRPKAHLASGTQITNVALISFDGQPEIATNQRSPFDPTSAVVNTRMLRLTRWTRRFPLSRSPTAKR